MSGNYQILTIRLLVNDFRLKLLKYVTWNAELRLCEYGISDTNGHLVFYSQHMNRSVFKNVLLEQKIPSSLVAFIDCNIEKMVRPFIDLLKVNDFILDSCHIS